jgi:hypothetical protein
MNDYDRYLVERVHGLAVQCSEWFGESFSVMIDEDCQIFLCQGFNTKEQVRNSKELDRLRLDYEKDFKEQGYDD